jgi:hypothetical protein
VGGVSVGLPHASLQRIAVDVLHTLDLGIAQIWGAEALLAALDSSANESTATQVEARREEGLTACRASLQAFYRERPGLTQCFLHAGVYGDPRAPSLKLKGIETRHLLLWLVGWLREHVTVVPHGALRVASGAALVQMYGVMRESPRVMSIGARRRFLAAFQSHMSAHMAAGGRLIPKHHLAAHLVQQACWLGNPRAAACLTDESLNGKVALIGATAPKAAFNRMLLEKSHASGLC